MFIAPSTIVINSAFDDGNYRNKSTNDTMIKAILDYEQDSLLTGSRLFDPQIILYRVLPNEDLEFITSAESIRYCFDEDNLIVEFDRGAVVDYLSVEKVKGLIDVALQGSFKLTPATVADGTMSLTGSFIEVEVTEEGQLLSINPVKGKVR